MPAPDQPLDDQLEAFALAVANGSTARDAYISARCGGLGLPLSEIVRRTEARVAWLTAQQVPSGSTGLPAVVDPLDGVPEPELADIRSLARYYTVHSMRELWRMATGAESETARVAALKEINDRGWGKPAQTVNVRQITSVHDLTDEEIKVIADEARRQGITIDGTARDITDATRH